MGGINVDHVLGARFLPVTLRKFPVSVLQIHDVNDDDEERVSFVATLAGRVREPGAPELNYIDPSLSPEGSTDRRDAPHLAQHVHRSRALRKAQASEHLSVPDRQQGR
ncbi:hypothetical protein ACETU7_04020 [Rhodococcus sp. 3Y1]